MVISSGSQWFQGQTKAQPIEPGRRGVGRNQVGGCETTMVAVKPPPSGGGGIGICCTGQLVALQPSLEGCGAHS